MIREAPRRGGSVNVGIADLDLEGGVVAPCGPCGLIGIV